MKENALVLSARKVDFQPTDDNGNISGDRVQLCVLQTLDTDIDRDDNFYGYRVSEYNAELDLLDSLQAGPGVYELTYRKRPMTNRSGKTKVTLVPTAAEFLSEIDLEALVGVSA